MIYFDMNYRWWDIILRNEFKVDFGYIISLEQIEKDEIMDETKAIMALIYRDYFCDKDTRKKLLKKEEQELKIENEKYNDIFKNKQINNKNEQTFNKLSGIKEEKWYIKIWNKIRVYCNKLRK